MRTSARVSQHCNIPAHFTQMIEIIIDLSQTIHSFITIHPEQQLEWQFHMTYTYVYGDGWSGSVAATISLVRTPRRT